MSIRSPAASDIFASLLYLLLLLLLSVPEFATSHGHKRCNPSSCGDLQNITHPFRLHTDPPGCGYPSFELLCESNHAFWVLPFGNYSVTQVSYEGEYDYKQMVVRLVDVGLASGTCGLPSGSLSRRKLADDERFHWWFSNARGSFVNCTRKIDDRSYIPIPCLSSNTTTVYVVDETVLSYLRPSCHFIAMVPTDSYWNSSQDIFKLCQNGFELWWTRVHESILEMIRYCADGSTGGFPGWVLGFNLPRQISIYVGSVLFCLFEEWSFVHPTSPVASFASRVAVVVMYTILILTALVLVERFIFAPITLLVFLAHKFRMTRVTIDNVEKFLRSQQSLTPTRYSYNDIIIITRNFKEKLGQGGFGSVFKGVLPGSRLYVAVKVLSNSKFSGEEFINEVSTIGRIHHVNIVQLVGFCSERHNRALVYEFMPNGSLDKHIFTLNWSCRQFSSEKLNEIALGVARGIDYLHRGCDMQILHFDIKPHNILLDHSFSPKVSDFGLAKLYPKDYSLVSISAARGTIGYIAPELISRNFGVVSDKSDVYSFGMLLLEMAGGKRNFNQQVDNSSEVYYPSWIYERLNQIEDLEMTNAFEITELERKLCLVGLWCIQMKPLDRPSMSKVVEMLEADVDTIRMPPKPFFSTPRTLSLTQSCLDYSSTELSIVLEDE